MVSANASGDLDRDTSKFGFEFAYAFVPFPLCSSRSLGKGDAAAGDPTKSVLASRLSALSDETARAPAQRPAAATAAHPPAQPRPGARAAVLAPARADA